MPQVIYSLTPLWSALFSWWALGDEAGSLTWIGGAVILCASLLATSEGDGKRGGKEEEDMGGLC